jgi:outer membrane protein OmpA-like peptidoglycan-associated protein
MTEQQAQARQRETERLRQEAQRAQELEAQIAQMKELEARETPRGLVLSLPDVLFDVDKAQLKTGAERTLEKLATVLKNNPERTISIEGFTDSTGSDTYNRQLSEKRADAVREALVGLGVNPERIQTRGYGENYPIASNQTPAGRQLNRRVEIIISHGDETVSRR